MRGNRHRRGSARPSIGAAQETRRTGAPRQRRRPSRARAAQHATESAGGNAACFRRRGSSPSAISDRLHARRSRSARATAVSYTHLDVYKRQAIHRVRSGGPELPCLPTWSARRWGLAGGVPATVLCPLRGPAGRRLIALPRPRLPIAVAAPWWRVTGSDVCCCNGLTQCLSLIHIFPPYGGTGNGC